MTTALADAVAQARADVAEMPQVLAELELLSHGRVRPLDAPTTTSSSRSVLLRVDQEPYPHELYRARWYATSTAFERAAVLADARAEAGAFAQGAAAA